MAISVFGEIPAMILKSIQSTYVFQTYTKAEMIIYDLEDWYFEQRIVDTTHILVIPYLFFQEAEIKAMVANITMKWIHIPQQSLSKSNWYYNDCYAYESHNGDIFFKLPGLKKQMKFDKSLLNNPG